MNLNKFWQNGVLAHQIFFLTRALADIMSTIVRVWWLFLALLVAFVVSNYYSLFVLQLIVACVSFFILLSTVRPSVMLKSGTYYLQEFKYFPAFLGISIPLLVLLYLVPINFFYKNLLLWPCLAFAMYQTLFLFDGPLCLRFSFTRARKLFFNTKLAWVSLSMAAFFTALGLINLGFSVGAAYCLVIVLYACFIANIYIQQRYEQFDNYA